MMILTFFHDYWYDTSKHSETKGRQPMKIDILKTHGSYNDFILIDEYSNDYGLNDEQRTSLTRTLCDRDHSIGADGILLSKKR